MQPQWTTLVAHTTRYCSVIVLWAGLVLITSIRTVVAQDASTFDWRANLTCQTEHQVRSGILYCTGQDRTGAPVHVILIDLAHAGIRIEYILPKGASEGHAGIAECRDVNVPDWGGPARGCFVSGNRNEFPRLTLLEATARAREVRDTPDLAVVINADYGAPDALHGPEGLTIVRGARLDGAANCDDDYNAALRPWLALGETVDDVTGVIPALISSLESDADTPSMQTYTGIGGGPWLIQDGVIFEGAADCTGNKSLTQLTPIEGCTGNPKSAQPPKNETYISGSCRLAPHTAAGLSQDGRWLFLAISTSNEKPDVLADFLRNHLGVWNALKLDGGGSSQLWFGGPPAVTFDIGGQNRPLTNYLAVYANKGPGIDLPLEATPTTRLLHQVVLTGQRVKFDLQVQNTGTLSWTPEDQVALRQVPGTFGQLLDQNLLTFPVASVVQPGDLSTWEWEIASKTVSLYRFQMVHGDRPFGDELGVLIIPVPKQLEDRRKEIEDQVGDIIANWERQGSQKLDELTREIERLIVEQLEQVVSNICPDIGLTLMAPLVMLWWLRRRSRR